MSDADDDGILRRARLGIDTQAFLRSDLGKFLLDRAQDEADAALDELRRLALEDPGNAVAISAAGHKVMRFDDFDRWLREAIEIGAAAEIEAVEMDGHEPE